MGKQVMEAIKTLLWHAARRLGAFLAWGWARVAPMAAAAAAELYRRGRAAIQRLPARWGQASSEAVTPEDQERFAAARGQLQNTTASVRQEGADALFRLARDNPGQRETIADILCQHLRTVTGDAAYQNSHKSQPSKEVQSLLALLFTPQTQSEQDMDTFWEEHIPDLSGGYFRGAVLDSAQFQDAKLDGVQFQGARLFAAQFQGARLFAAQFQRARLFAAQFHEARLGDAGFQGAELGGACFQDAELEAAQFHVARLGETNFQGASLANAKFQGAHLRGAQFQGAWLRRAQFQWADDLTGAKFQGAELRGTQFQGAKLAGADFAGATSETDERQSIGFARRIRQRVGQDSDCGGIRFEGGMSDGRVADIVWELKQVPNITPKQIRDFEQAMGPHIDGKGQDPLDQKHMAASCKGRYNKAQAEEWIKEHPAPVGAGPEADEAAGADQEQEEDWSGAQLPKTQTGTMGATKQRAKQRWTSSLQRYIEKRKQRRKKRRQSRQRKRRKASLRRRGP